MSVDFTPSRGEYTELKPFRYWCQKVLPLVYDDSLSYYELLSKILDSLNKAMEDVETLNDDVTALYTAYTALQDWVNDYVETFFEGEGIADAVDAGIDRMVVSGEFGTIVNDKVASQINAVVSSQIGGTVQTQLPGVVSRQINPVVANQLPGVVNNNLGDVADAWLQAHVQSQTGTLDHTINSSGSSPLSFPLKNLIQGVKGTYSFIDKYLLADYADTDYHNDVIIFQNIFKDNFNPPDYPYPVRSKFYKKGNKLVMTSYPDPSDDNPWEINAYPSVIPITRNLIPPLNDSWDASTNDAVALTLSGLSGLDKNAINKYFVNINSGDTIKVAFDLNLTHVGGFNGFISLDHWKLIKVYVSNNAVTSQDLAEFTLTADSSGAGTLLSKVHGECEYTFGNIDKEIPGNPNTIGFGLAIVTGENISWGHYSGNTNYMARSNTYEMTITGEVVDAEVADLKAGLTDILTSYEHIEPFIYKRNTYINTNGVETTLAGYDLYKIPVQVGDLIQLKQTDAENLFFSGISDIYALNYLTSSGYSRILPGGQTTEHPNYRFRAISSVNITATEFMGFIEDGTTALMICVKRGNENSFWIKKNGKNAFINEKQILKNNDTAYYITKDNSAVGQLYKITTEVTQITTAGYSIRTIEVKQGDKIIVSALTTAISYWGKFVDKNTLTSINTTQIFTVPSDGYLHTFWYTEDNNTVLIIPATTFKVDWTQLLNVPDSTNPFTGLTGVAFGTSLTYRAISSWGYLDYLPNLSGITFDNQGIGSSVILGNMLTAIKNYTGYSDKRVCLIEGFVNDWYLNNTLGTYEDTTETTVCGCVRSAINYILSQNANITIFLILDNYGKLYSNVDCRSFAENSGGLTQLEYYDEIAKVAQSLGVPVIKLYANSQISENTPQYLNDNIHPTDLGAKQTAYTIWSKMKQCYPNQVTG